MNGDDSIDNSWTIFHSNIRGYNSKKESLNTILNKVNPNIITLNEHGLKNKQKLKIPGFNSYTRNRVNQQGGGVSTSIVEAEKQSAVKVTDGDNSNEFIVTRHGQFKRPINIINVYGEIENRTNNDNIFDKWQKIVEQCHKILQRNEELINLRYE